MRDAKSNQIFPLWRKQLYYHDRGNWHTMKILVDYESGFNQVIRFLSVDRHKILIRVC